MRLRRLDLTRYGKFTDHAIDFGPPSEDGPDLHVIYGPNEAGKSTLFNAWLDLLFGIHPQSSYNFLHPYPNMRIGATVEIDGVPREFVRLKRQQNSLRDGQDQPVSGTALQAALGGLDRDTYRTMFSLDSISLKQGGEAILASHGDLGELLFSASAGLGELSRNLAAIRAETEAFYKYRSRSGELAELKSSLSQLKAERDRLDTQVSEYAQLGNAHAEASRRHGEATARRGQLRAELATISAVLTALPWAGELDRLERELEPLAALPDVVPGWRDEVAALMHEDARLEAAGQEIDRETERLAAELEAVRPDERILSMRGRMDDLAKLRTRHDAAAEDLAERHLQLSRIDAAIGHILAALGRPDAETPSALLLDTRAASDLADLIDQRTAVDARHAAARGEAETARATFKEAAASLSELEGSAPAAMDADTEAAHMETGAGDMHSAALAELVRTLAEIRRQDHGLRLTASERALVPARERLETAMAALAPWNGTIEALTAMIPPEAAELEAWKLQAREIEQQSHRIDEDIRRSEQVLHRLEAEREAVLRSSHLLPEETVEALRVTRDEAWFAHKSALDRDTAERFETAMGEHDRAAERHLANQADAARLRQIAHQSAIATAELENANAALASLAGKTRRHRSRIQAAIAGLDGGLDPDLSPGALEAWLHRRNTALDAQRAVREIEHAIAAAQDDRQSSVERLSRALRTFNADAGTGQPSPGFEDLLARADAVVVRQTALAELGQAVHAARTELKRREADLQRAEEASTAWLLAWKAVCAQSWIGERDQVPKPGEAREILALLAKLGPEVTQRAGLADRIAKMERDQADYLAALDRLVAEMDMSDSHASSAELARRLDQRFAAAETARTRQQALTAQLDGARARQREHNEARALHQAKSARMLEALEAKTLSDAALKIENALRARDLRERIAQLSSRIRITLNAGTIDEAKTRLRHADPADLGDRKQDLEAELERHDNEVQQIYAALTRVAEARDAVGGDDAVARIEQQGRTLMLAIAEQAERYLKLSAGVIAMEQALALYREKHRSTMMKRASDAVRTISRGRYTGLASQPDKGRELLIALQHEGPSIQVSEMSQGTEFQLYLALRIAGYHEFVGSRPTVPFIADDIMETFDNFRAEETFRLFADMSTLGQVIYLTHHSHLCEIARSVCPGVRIHHLEA